ncbi:5485_t:CDS:2, partial [Funneliformis geosporum]
YLTSGHELYAGFGIDFSTSASHVSLSCDDQEEFTKNMNITHFGEDAWNKVYQAWLARHCNILLKLFTGCLPNLSEQAKNGLFDTFSRCDAFGVLEHNALLDVLTHPVEGLSLSRYYQLGFV